MRFERQFTGAPAEPGEGGANGETGLPVPGEPAAALPAWQSRIERLAWALEAD